VNGNSFLKDAALLTGLVTGVLSVVFVVILPLYAPSSPISSQVQANEQAVTDNERDAIRRQAATIELLRQALIASCERGNVIRQNQRVVLRHHDGLEKLTGSVPDVDCAKAVR
jgi:Tfp pilus assembly protein PilN